MDRLKSRFPIYSRLMRLYPADYQRNYGEQMLQTLADMLDDPEQSKAATWLRTVSDFPISVSKQQLIYTGAAMVHDTPNYLKRNALLGAVLLLPFPIVIILNSVTSHRLHIAQHWQVGYITLIALPFAAFLLGAATFLYWMTERYRKAGSSFWKSLIDIRHSWPVIAITGLGLAMALFVPFHDSVHCVTDNPIHKITYLRQTWHCIQQSR